ncbi:hypothetical protein HWQ67_19115, partial [Candidatus Magnetobacterium casensis]|nr:hypothetical protein [Candidatus Magnetobacterium casensis]
MTIRLPRQLAVLTEAVSGCYYTVMHQKFDIALKDIIKDVPGTFLRLLTGYETGKFIDV